LPLRDVPEAFIRASAPRPSWFGRGTIAAEHTDDIAIPITRHSISGSVDAAYAVYISRSFYVRVSHQPRVASLSWVPV
jgi:hypothetical protein